MKKAFFGFLAIILALFAIAGIFAYSKYQQLSEQYGLSQAEQISHDIYITPVTRTQLVITPEKFKGFIERHLPPFEIPAYVPYEKQDLLEMGLPYRIALVGHTNLRDNSIDFLAFINEQIGGPLITDEINKSGALSRLPDISIDGNEAKLTRRGDINLSGKLHLPEGLGVFVNDNAMLGGPQIKKEITGEHLIELAIDNGNGELLTMTGLMMDAMGVDWNNIFNAQEFKMAMPIFQKVETVHMYGDMITDDEMSIHLRVDSAKETEFIFNMVKSMGMPEIKRYMAEFAQLELTGEPAWSKEEEAFIGDFKLKGVEKYLSKPFQNIKF